MSQWWLDQLNPKGLSQGDVLLESIVPTLDDQVFLRKEAVANHAHAWIEGPWAPSAGGMGHYLGRGKLFGSLVLSHSCELDKGTGKLRLIVAAIQPITNVSTKEDADRITAGRRFSAMPLPGIPNLGDCYADLRVVGSITRAIADSKRIASMTDEAVERLHFQLVAFLTRLPLDKLRDGGAGGDG